MAYSKNKEPYRSLNSDKGPKIGSFIDKSNSAIEKMISNIFDSPLVFIKESGIAYGNFSSVNGVMCTDKIQLKDIPEFN